MKYFQHYHSVPQGDITNSVGGGKGRGVVLRGSEVTQPRPKDLAPVSEGVKLSQVQLDLILIALLLPHFRPINIQLVCKVGRVRFSRQK